MKNSSTMSQQYTGFTLAEVLITLGIIGVVAAITIPALINRTNNAELKNAFKKKYAEISLAIEQVTQDNGGSFKCLANDEFAPCYYGGQVLNSMLKSRLKYLKSCGVGSEDPANGYCFHHTAGAFGPYDFKTLNGVNTEYLFAMRMPNYNGADTAGFILTDGSYMVFFYDRNTAIIGLDINGAKKPNVMGRDIFTLGVNTDGVTYTFAPDGSVPFDCVRADGSYGAGGGCANWVLNNIDY